MMAVVSLSPSLSHSLSFALSLSLIFSVLHASPMYTHYTLLSVSCPPFTLSSLSLPLPPALQHGADINRRNRDNLIALDLVKDQEGDLADLLRGDAALLDAAKKGDLDRIKKLLTSENINCRDEEGRNSTLLHLAGVFICTCM